jgi:RNA polymerase sigma factor (sigma-70 family)
LLAEEAVQEAFTRILAKPLPNLASDMLTAYWLKVVHGTAVDLARASAARRKREESSGGAEREMPKMPDESAHLAETALAARKALAELPLELRQAVSLCCEQGLTRRQAAAVLEVPERTVSDWVNRGLEQLRKVLTAGGFSAVPAVLGEALGALGVPQAPKGLAEKLQQQALGSAANLGHAAAWSKGGLLVKIGIGVFVLGLVCVGLLSIHPGRSEETEEKEEAPPAVKPGKFTTPVTDAGAQWSRDSEPWAGSGVSAYLDGPRKEMCCRNAPGRSWWFEPGGDFTIRRYNPANERYYTVAGRARGQLDGPFSRARFGGIGYMRDHAVARSPDGRFVYFTEPDLGGQLRVMDFEKQTVATMSKDFKFTGMTADGKGNLWGMNWSGLTVISSEGVVLETHKLEMTGNLQQRHTFQNIALDESNRRLYASNRGSGDWTIWYWDLAADGKFVGVLPLPKENEPKRTLNETGPFKGTVQRCPGGIAFGPGDPEKRYLYQGGGDNTTFYRLDLEQELIDTFGPVNPAEKTPYKTLGWVQAKWLPFGSISKWCGTPTFDEEGNVYMGVSLGGIIIRFTRVK